MTTTSKYGLDKKVIAYWDAHKEILPEVLSMDRGKFRELLDAIPAHMKTLRKKLEEHMP